MRKSQLNAMSFMAGRVYQYQENGIRKRSIASQTSSKVGHSNPAVHLASGNKASVEGGLDRPQYSQEYSSISSASCIDVSMGISFKMSRFLRDLSRSTGICDARHKYATSHCAKAVCDLPVMQCTDLPRI